MAAAKSPRLCVSISERQHEVLAELGLLQSRSSASFLREMLDAAMPMFEALLPIYRAAAQAQAIQPEALQVAIRQALDALEGERGQLDLLEHLARVQPALANDQADAAGAPSEARAHASAGTGRRKRS
jgi:hypothetical protein